MMNRMLSLAVVGGLMIVSVGCNNSPQGGNPGTSDSFKVSAPVMTTTIKQGEKETVTLTLQRGTDFKKNVEVKADAPKGLNVVMKSSRVNASDPADVSFTVEADKAAPLGDHIIKVTATPESGAATTVDVKVNVKEGPKS
jgi:uncharacterized membrane protein